jgi:hypothetical protein
MYTNFASIILFWLDNGLIGFLKQIQKPEDDEDNFSLREEFSLPESFHKRNDGK